MDRRARGELAFAEEGGKSRAGRNKFMVSGDKYKVEGNDGHTASPWSRAPTMDLWPGARAVQGCVLCRGVIKINRQLPPLSNKPPRMEHLQEPR